MPTIVHRKLKYRICTILSFFGQKPSLPIDLILSPTDDVIEDRSNSKFVEDWKTQMSEACQKALQNSGHKK